MDFINILGTVAGVLTTASFIPQVAKTWKSRSAKDVSLAMFFVLATGIILWIIYGFLVSSLPVILANSATLVLVFTMITLKLKFK